MWLLRNDEKGLIFRVTPGKQIVVSRKDGELLLVGDQSISRKHAQLFVDDENDSEGVKVKDLESKYGTFAVIGDKELTQLIPNQEVILSNGDSVKFGIQWNCWRAEFVPLLVATSTLVQEEKAEVRRLVAELGGRVVADWQPKCSHLTMNKLTVTVKVVCALAAAIPIVTPAYWRSFAQALASMKTTLPECQHFVPPLVEDMLNPAEVSFTPNTHRSKLFSGCTFVASSLKQLARITPMITAAGGRAVEFSPKAWPEERLMMDKIILMQHSANERLGSQQSQIPDGYFSIARKLRAQGVRCIPESEVGLSVIHCSLTQYCNPRWSAQSLLGNSDSMEPTQPINIICPDSEESMSSDKIKNECSGDTVPSTSKKRPLKELSDIEEPTCKRADKRGESEDLFSSQNLNDTRTPRKDSISKKTPPSSSSSASKRKGAFLVPNPSLDMFAPSGESTGSSQSKRPSDIKPSCEDLFAPTASNRPPEGRADNENELLSTGRKLSNRHQQISVDQGEFSFSSRRGKIKEVDGGDFSFSSTKGSLKRTRNSDPDMFGSSNDPSSSNMAVAGPSKVRKTEPIEEFSVLCAKQRPVEENVFGWPEKEKSTRKHLKKSLPFDNSDQTSITSKEEELFADTPNKSEMKTVEDPPERKDLIIYSKSIPMPAHENQENVGEEVDELAKQLHNATIVVVKSLVVAKPKPPDTSTATTGKNFKKFRKVVGINKRLVPHIIGGSDLVVHKVNGEEPRRPPSPDPEDDWGFPSCFQMTKFCDFKNEKPRRSKK